jgi:hypothetical protein
VSAELRSALTSGPEFAFTRLRSRRIRDIGRVEIFVASGARGASAVPVPGADPAQE